MIFLFNVLKYLLKSVLLFWYPFGRSSVKEYRYFVRTILSVSLSVVPFVLILKHWFPDSELFRLFICAADWIAANGMFAVLFLFFAIESAAIRRGHDLGYSAFYTVTHYIQGTEFERTLISRAGQPYANEYGPAPEENRCS